MFIQFTRDSAGWRRVPRYVFADWRLVHHDRDRLVYRPSSMTFLRRLGWSALCAVVVAGLYLGLLQPIEQAGIPAALIERLSDPFMAAAWGLIGFFVLVGLLAPLSVLWSSITLSRDIRGNLVVAACTLLPRSRMWPIERLGRISLIAIENVATGRRPRMVWRLGWLWHIRLEGKSHPSVGESGPLIEFCPYQQKDRPTEGGRLPAQVATFVGWLSGATGLAAPEPAVADYIAGARRHAPVVTGHRVTSVAGPTEERHVYHSLEEMPAELRVLAEQRIDQFREQGKTTGSFEIVSEQSFGSLEEVPPELHGEAERAIAAARAHGMTPGFSAQLPPGTPGHRITVRDADGRIHTFNSPEEMPPDLRAQYEHMRRRHR